MKDLILKIKSTKLVQIFMAIITYYVIIKLELLKAYNFVSWMILLILILFYMKSDIFNHKYKKDIISFSFLFSLILVFGDIVYYEKDNPNVSFLRELFTFDKLVIFIGIFNCFVKNLLLKPLFFVTSFKK